MLPTMLYHAQMHVLRAVIEHDLYSWLEFVSHFHTRIFSRMENTAHVPLHVIRFTFRSVYRSALS